MSAEAFVWPEGSIYLWTGTATASAVPGYAQNIQATFVQGWDNYATLTGGYVNTLTGERADVVIGGLATYDTALTTLIAAGVDIHMHIRVDALGLSAGRYLYSGRVDQYVLAGREGDAFQYSIAYHANVWSAYG